MKASGRRKQKGFTLLEIMISLALICLVVVSVIELLSADLRHLGASDNYVDLLADANEKMRAVLEMEKLEEKTWNETGRDSLLYEIDVKEIEKERSKDLAVQMMQITVTVSRKQESRERTVTLQSAKMISRAQALESSKDEAPEGYVD